MIKKNVSHIKTLHFAKGLVGEIINRFERKGLHLLGMKNGTVDG